MKDITRIEYSIIPALLETYLKALYKNTKDEVLIIPIEIVNKEFFSYFDDLPDKKRHSLYRRSDRICNKIIAYTKANDFDCRKAIMTILGWLYSLAKAGAISLKSDTKYWNLLTELGEQIQSGLEIIPDLEQDQAATERNSGSPRRHPLAFRPVDGRVGRHRFRRQSDGSRSPCDDPNRQNGRGYAGPLHSA